MNKNCSNDLLSLLIILLLTMFFFYKYSNIDIKEEFSLLSFLSPIPPVKITTNLHDEITNIVKTTTNKSVSSSTATATASAVVKNDIHIHGCDPSKPIQYAPVGFQNFTFETMQKNVSDVSVEAIQKMKIEDSQFTKMADKIHNKIKDTVNEGKAAGLFDDGISVTTNKTNIVNNIHETLKNETEKNIKQSVEANSSSSNVLDINTCGMVCSDHNFDTWQKYGAKKGGNPCKMKLSQENLAKAAAKQTAGAVMKNLQKVDSSLKVLSSTTSKVDRKPQMGAGAALCCCCCCCCCCCLLIPLIGIVAMKASSGDLSSDSD